MRFSNAWNTGVWELEGLSPFEPGIITPFFSDGSLGVHQSGTVNKHIFFSFEIYCSVSVTKITWSNISVFPQQHPRKSLDFDSYWIFWKN